MAFFGRFRRLLVVLDEEHESVPTLRAAAHWAPQVGYLHCVRLTRPSVDVESASDADEDPFAALTQGLSAWRAMRPRLQVDYSLSVGFDIGALAALARRLQVELVALAPLRAYPSRDRTQLMMRLCARDHCHVLSVGQRACARQAELGLDAGAPTRVVLALDAEGASVAPLAGFMDELAPGASAQGFVVGADEAQAAQVATLFQSHRPDDHVMLTPLPAESASLVEAVNDAASAEGAQLMVLAADAAPTLEALALRVLASGSLQRASCPVLALPRSPEAAPLFVERLSVSDALMLAGHDTRVAIERAGALGPVALSSSQPLRLLDQERAIGPLRHARGLATIPERFSEAMPDQHTVLVELEGAYPQSAAATLLRPQKPLILLDSTLDGLPLASISERAKDFQLIFVRMRRSLGLDDNRERLRNYAPALGMAPLIDAGAWLDDGGADDVPPFADGQRLLRVALHLVERGARVSAIVTKHQPLHTHLCVALTERTWRQAVLSPREARPTPTPTAGAERLHAELDLSSHSRRLSGHKVHFELDNAGARGDLMQRIAAAQQRIHLQSELLEDDDVCQRFAFALKSAAARGIQVRWLVDPRPDKGAPRRTQSALLAQLNVAPGMHVQFRSPPPRTPGLPAFKRRNPHTVIVLDGRRAIVTGRELGTLGYRGHEEVRITPTSSYADLPWLGGGVHVQGPLVRELEGAFLNAWVRAGGTSFELLPCAAVGPVQARLVLHEGLRDTHGLDAQLALVRHARQELVIVDTFPLVVELQQALLAAIKRDVRVRILFGNLRPCFGEGTRFVRGPFRPLADQLVRAALDPIVRAGGEVYECTMAPAARWDPALLRVFPHLHAKLLMRDRRDVALGSADLDVTAAYWESETLLIVHDENFAASVEATVAPYFASALRIDRHAGALRADTARRRWLQSCWPAALG
jgi:cardiolipin synthase